MTRWMTLALLLTACSGDKGSDDGTDETPDTDTDTDTVPTDECEVELVLGAGESTFTALSAGDDVQFVHGPQGQWHIDLAGQLSGVGDEVGLHADVRVPSLGDHLLSGEQQQDFKALANYDEDGCGSGEFVGQRALIAGTPIEADMNALQFVCSLEGEDLEICLQASDLATGSATEECILVKAKMDPTDNCDGPACTPGVFIGAGADYTPLADADPLTMLNDGAGGWYLELSGLVDGSPDTINIASSATLVTGATDLLVPGAPESVTLIGFQTGATPCGGTFGGIRAELDGTLDDICAWQGEEATVCVTASAGATSFEDCATVVLALDPTDTCP